MVCWERRRRSSQAGRIWEKSTEISSRHVERTETFVGWGPWGRLGTSSLNGAFGFCFLFQAKEERVQAFPKLGCGWQRMLEASVALSSMLDEKEQEFPKVRNNREKALIRSPNWSKSLGFAAVELFEPERRYSSLMRAQTLYLLPPMAHSPSTLILADLSLGVVLRASCHQQMGVALHTHLFIPGNFRRGGI